MSVRLIFSLSDDFNLAVAGKYSPPRLLAREYGEPDVVGDKFVVFITACVFIFCGR